MDMVSVGIDIGTTTTQVVFSRITVENTASYFSVPKVDIIDKKVIYKSDIMMTPLKNEDLIDGNKIKILVEEEYKKARFIPEDIQTGAVIITGESALKENAEAVLESLSNLAGEFVVSTAGPDLEAIIAGKGSGACRYSSEYGRTVANMDIGGGTTNIVLFNNGEVVSKGALDIGGRLVKIDKNNIITYVSPKIKLISDYMGVNLKVGSEAVASDLSAVTDKMSDILEYILGISDFSEMKQLADKLCTPGSRLLEIPEKIDCIFLTGGVSELIYNSSTNNMDNPFPYGDIGKLLGASIAKGKLMEKACLHKPSEIMSATVVGAGSYTTSISGSTITYTKDIFPVKNAPVLVLNNDTEEKCYSGDKNALVKEITWFREQTGRDELMLSLRGLKNPCYTKIKSMAQCISDAFAETSKGDAPIMIVVNTDIAKALGQAIDIYLEGKRSVICIDSINVSQGDYVDMGKPILNGVAIPIVVKTLIFK